MTKRLALLLFAFALLGAQSAAADYLVADLSKRRIDITMGFAGAEVLLFGATDGKGDVVVVVRGPAQSVLVRRKERIAGIWANRDWMRFDNVPAFYFETSTQPLESIASGTTLSESDIGVDNLRFTVPEASAGASLGDFRAALIREKEREGLFGSGSDKIQVLGEHLFRTTVSLPATVAPGPYSVEVFLIRDGVVESAQKWPLYVNKVGLSAEVDDRAHRQSLLYGLVAVLIAAMAGWLGALGFGKL